MNNLGTFISGVCEIGVSQSSPGRCAFNGTVWAIIGAAFIAMSVGCGDTMPVPVSVSTDVETVPVTETTSVAVSAVQSEVSPAKQETKTLDADASPEDVCRLFMKYLNSGDRVKAERLLTSVAFDTTAKAGLYLQPMGSADAGVEIGPVAYVTNKQQLAHVNCTITENSDGSITKDELTWMVRKSKSGWRIFGMLLTMEEGHQDFLSLENAQDVDTILQISGGNDSVGISEGAAAKKAELKVTLK